MRRFLAALLIVAVCLPTAAQAGIYDSILVLVNKQNALPEDYEPADLSHPNVAFAPNVSASRKQMREVAARALEAMFAAALEDGVELLGISGYRSYATQSGIYYTRLAESGLEHVSQYVAMPGQSEHQTGLAMDLGSSDCPILSEEFANTAAYAWLSEHAHEYGFIIRYTQDGTAETGYAFEPWHIRYVGDVAVELWESGMTLEAWYRQRVSGSHPRRERRFALSGW